MREAKEGGGIWLAPNAGCQVLEKCLVIELVAVLKVVTQSLTIRPTASWRHHLLHEISDIHMLLPLL